MILPNIWKNKKCSKPPTRYIFARSITINPKHSSSGLGQEGNWNQTRVPWFRAGKNTSTQHVKPNQTIFSHPQNSYHSPSICNHILLHLVTPYHILPHLTRLFPSCQSSLLSSPSMITPGSRSEMVQNDIQLV